MNTRKEGIPCLVTFLIIGLSIRFADCLLELALDAVENMKYGMQCFNQFEKWYNECRGQDLTFELDSIGSTQLSKETKHLEKELACVRKLFSDFEKSDYEQKNKTEEEYIARFASTWVVQFVALENCSLFLQAYAHYNGQEKDIASQFANIALYLAAFGANPKIGTLLYNNEVRPLKIYLFRDKKEKYPENLRDKVEEIPYNKLVEKIHKITFLHYNKDEDKWDADLEYYSYFEELNSYTCFINSVLKDILFAIKPMTPGFRDNKERFWQRISADTNRELFWEEILKPENQVFELIKTINSSIHNEVPDESPGESKLIHLLREIEKLKIKVHKNGMVEQIEEIAGGFGDEEKLEVYIVPESVYLPDYILFTKSNSNNKTQVLADGSSVEEFLKKWRQFLDEHLEKLEEV